MISDFRDENNTIGDIATIRDENFLKVSSFLFTLCLDSQHFRLAIAP